MKKIIMLISMLIVSIMMSGCYFMIKDSGDSINGSRIKSNEPDGISATQVTDKNKPDKAEKDITTPYQFLNIITANASELSFSYSINGSIEEAVFQKSEDVSVETYIAKDMYNNNVSVRELEKNGKVHYIMDESKTIKTYLAPAEDYLLYRMMNIVKNIPDSVTKDGEYSLFKYSEIFEQDESMKYSYSFYMKDGVLTKLTIALGDRAADCYEFSDFKQELIDKNAFFYPKGYYEEKYSYIYTGDNIPPWWEINNEN